MRLTYKIATLLLALSIPATLSAGTLPRSSSPVAKFVKSVVKLATTGDGSWKDIDPKTIEHPSDLFDVKPVAKEAKKILGKDYKVFSDLIYGPGSGEWNSDGQYVAEVCRKHSCSDEGVFIFADPKSGSLLLAWKPKNKPVKIYSGPVNGWPKTAQEELKKWSKQWPKPI